MGGIASIAAAEVAAAVPDRGAGLGRWLGRRALAPGVALLMGAFLLASAREDPLPAFGWAAAFLTLAVERDVRERRIPNWLTLPALVLLLIRGAWLGGLPGFGTALLGAGAALAILFVPFAVGWFGAGDVKAMMVLGAFWGGSVLLPVLAWSVLVGGPLALVWVAARGMLPELLTRWSQTLLVALATRRIAHADSQSGSPAVTGIPFAVAMAIGVAAYQQLGAPWA